MKKQKSSIRHPRGFTLVELIIVISIIVVLAGITIAAIGGMNRAAAKKATATRLQFIEQKIEEFRLDNGRYPGVVTPSDPSATAPAPVTASGNDDSTVALFLALSGLETVASTEPREGAKVYWAELAQKNPDVVDNAGRILDGYGNPFRFRVAQPGTPAGTSTMFNPDFDLWSVGPDGQTSLAASVTAFEEAEVEGRKVTADDITNF